MQAIDAITTLASAQCMLDATTRRLQDADAAVAHLQQQLTASRQHEVALYDSERQLLDAQLELAALRSELRAQGEDVQRLQTQLIAAEERLRAAEASEGPAAGSHAQPADRDAELAELRHELDKAQDRLASAQADAAAAKQDVDRGRAALQTAQAKIAEVQVQRLDANQQLVVSQAAFAAVQAQLNASAAEVLEIRSRLDAATGQPTAISVPEAIDAAHDAVALQRHVQLLNEQLATGSAEIAAVRADAETVRSALRLAQADAAQARAAEEQGIALQRTSLGVEASSGRALCVSLETSAEGTTQALSPRTLAQVSLSMASS